MKKRGFTLIELLAVIVILAIIALIATPIVMNVIENSRKGAAERSAENYIDAVEMAVAAERIDGPVEDGEYEVMSDGNLCKGTISGTTCTGTKLTVDISENKPSSGGKIIIENGQVVDKLTGDESKKTTMSVGDYTVSYDANGKIFATKGNSENNTVTVYRYSEEQIKIGDPINPSNYTTDAATLGKDFYLKHVLDKDNKVAESSLCTILKDKDKEICIRGIDGNGTSYYDENKLILEGEDLECSFSGSSFCCDIFNGFCLGSDGHLHTDDRDGACDVEKTGVSYCTDW